jgi:hypothetical protein
MDAMAFCYIVRCGFTEPSREQAWNAWYSGPKIEQMLAQPHFLTCQRFRLAAGRGRGYLTLWTVDSPQALATPQYTAQWGFAEWAPYVADWSRDLFDGGAASEQAFAVDQEGALAVVSFDRMSPEDADTARAALARTEPEMVWLPVIGLDRHTPLIGLRPVGDLASAHPAADGGGVRFQPAIYRPITRVYSAPRVSLEADDR